MRIRYLALGFATASVMTLGGLTASTASAHVAGNPSPDPTCSPAAPGQLPETPSVNPQFGYNPCPTPRPRPVPTCQQRVPVPYGSPADNVGLTAYRGDPHPTPTETVTTPPPVPTPRAVCAPWTFDLQLSDIDGINVNDVRGRGAIGFNRWIDQQLSNNVDRFRSVPGGNSVTLWHEGLNAANAQLSVDRYTCTVDIQQLNARFFILNGTGIGQGWRVVGNTGRFNLEGQLSWDLVAKHRGGLQVCPLAFVSDGQILRAILSGNGGGLPAPATDDFSVQGRALLVRGVQFPPHFAPTVTPSA
jgi:hypothetical protein